MFERLQHLWRLLRANRLGSASRLEKKGKAEAAIETYEQMIRVLDTLPPLPSTAAHATIRDGLHLSLRVPALGGLAKLHAEAGRRDEAERVARVLPSACRTMAPETPQTRNWADWARTL